MSVDAEEVARRLEADNQLWIVIYGVSSREFVCFSRASVPFRAFLVARDPATLPPLMRKAENSAVRTAAAPNGKDAQPRLAPSPKETETSS